MPVNMYEYGKYRPFAPHDPGVTERTANFPQKQYGPGPPNIPGGSPGVNLPRSPVPQPMPRPQGPGLGPGGGEINPMILQSIAAALPAMAGALDPSMLGPALQGAQAGRQGVQAQRKEKREISAQKKRDEYNKRLLDIKQQEVDIKKAKKPKKTSAQDKAERTTNFIKLLKEKWANGELKAGPLGSMSAVYDQAVNMGMAMFGFSKSESEDIVDTKVHGPYREGDVTYGGFTTEDGKIVLLREWTDQDGKKRLEEYGGGILRPKVLKALGDKDAWGGEYGTKSKLVGVVKTLGKQGKDTRPLMDFIRLKDGQFDREEREKRAKKTPDIQKTRDALIGLRRTLRALEQDKAGRATTKLVKGTAKNLRMTNPNAVESMGLGMTPEGYALNKKKLIDMIKESIEWYEVILAAHKGLTAIETPLQEPLGPPGKLPASNSEVRESLDLRDKVFGGAKPMGPINPGMMGTLGETGQTPTQPQAQFNNMRSQLGVGTEALFFNPKTGKTEHR